MIRPEDDHFHVRSDDPYWNESAWFGFNVPDQLMTGFVYFFHRPNMNYSVGGVAIWDPSGEYEWDCRYYDWAETVELPEGADMFDFSLRNGLTVACEKELQAFKLDYKGEGCEVDLSFDAFLEPQGAALGSTLGLPKGSDEWGKGHYDQPGRIQGTIRLGSGTGTETIAVNSLSMRDHSWGPRRYTTNPRGNFAMAFANEQSGFCFFAGADLPRETDPCVGVPDPLIFGWYLRDGVSSRLISGERTVTERDDRGRPIAVVIDGVDELGRELHTEGRCRNALFWHGYPYLYQFWCMAEWDYDGHTGVVGEEQDFFPLQQARRYLRGLASTGR
jgi:hypothetical protein